MTVCPDASRPGTTTRGSNPSPVGTKTLVLEYARLEVLPTEFSLAAEHHATLQQRIKALGYRFVTLDLGGFRSGSLNEGLQPEQIQIVNIFDGQER